MRNEELNELIVIHEEDFIFGEGVLHLEEFIEVVNVDAEIDIPINDRLMRARLVIG
jgi:hypothetical protein